ncbi:MAG: isoprenylcysteine carboxylmethyltransferase family protein, partial [Nannocystaceae bacterium]
MTNDLLASVALAGLASYGLVAIVARSILQRRRTGSTGWRGVHGRPGSVEWWAGIMMAVAVLGLLAAPAIALFDPSAWVGTWRLGLGGLLYGLGFILTVRAQLQMGDAWRIG